MPVKSVREMNDLERRMHSISYRSFLTVFLLVLAIGIVSTIFALYMHSSDLNRECRTATWNLAHDANLTMQMDWDKVTMKCDEILDLYDSIPDEEKGDGTGEDYKALYADCIDENFREIQQTMRDVQATNDDAVAAYIVALDAKENRMIFLIDSDPKKSFCPPGTWDTYTSEIITTLLDGSKPSRFDTALGLDQSIPAVIVNFADYGYRCTAADRMYDHGDYHVLVCYDTDMDVIVSASKKFTRQYLLLLLIILVIASLITGYRIRKTTVGPINQLANAAVAYSEDKQNQIYNKKHFENLDIRTGDEIENLALTMKDMEADLDKHIRALTNITAEKERINTELNVASQIQLGMMPNMFPAFPDRKEFEIFGTMNPAKEVGGDFFDYFLIDEDHLAMVMADVSGKGIPAALFMMGSKIMINNFVKIMDYSPAKTLEKVNNQICESNKMEMFVTVWLGILEISTGRLRAASAGHEYPLIRRMPVGEKTAPAAGGRKGGDSHIITFDANGELTVPEGRFVMIKDPHGLVVGGMEGIVYKDYEIQLQPGDMLFEYTDGVPEATDAELEQFGTERMVAALNDLENESVRQTLESVSRHVHEFIREAPQFDDITMMCLHYFGPEGRPENSR